MYLSDETAQIPYLRLAARLLRPWPFHPQYRYVPMYKRNRHDHNHWKDKKRIDAIERIEKRTGTKNCFNVAKYNLGKVNLESMLASSLLTFVTQSGIFPLLGPSCDSYHSHLLAILVMPLLQHHLLAILVLFFSLPSRLLYVRDWHVLVCKYTIPLNSSVWWCLLPGGGNLTGCHGCLLPYARALPGSTNLVSNNVQVHLLVMGSMNSPTAEHLNHKDFLVLPCCYDSVLSLESVKRSIFKTQGNHTNASSFVHQQVQCKVFHKVFCVVT